MTPRSACPSGPGSHPRPSAAAPVAEIQLPRPDPDFVYSLDVMLTPGGPGERPSGPVDLATLGAVLYHATANVAAVDEPGGGDPDHHLSTVTHSWLYVYLAARGVRGVPSGVYRYDPVAHVLLDTGGRPGEGELAATVRRHDGAGVAAVSLFVVARWDRYRWLDRDSRARRDLLLRIGEYGQELLQAGRQLGLAGRLTADLAGARAAELLGLGQVGPDADPVYRITLGHPG
jgi:hypothetical protein